MSNKSISIARVSLFIGLIILFISLFLPWYQFVIEDNNNVVDFWIYNIFTGWKSLVSIPFLGQSRQPKEMDMSFILNVTYIIIILISMGITIFSNLEKDEFTERVKYYSYIYVLLLSLNGYYCFFFPVFQLILNDLYYPFVIYDDLEYLSFSYIIGPGLILQLIGFVTIFSYVMFYVITALRFKKESTSQDISFDLGDESIDFDRLIAEEEPTITDKKNPYSFEEIIHKRRKH